MSKLNNCPVCGKPPVDYIGACKGTRVYCNTASCNLFGINFSVGIWNGLPDRKPARVTVVMPKEWHTKLKVIAKQSGRSVNDVIGIALKNSFNFQGDKRPRGRPKKH